MKDFHSRNLRQRRKDWDAEKRPDAAVPPPDTAQEECEDSSIDPVEYLCWYLQHAGKPDHWRHQDYHGVAEEYVAGILRRVHPEDAAQYSSDPSDSDHVYKDGVLQTPAQAFMPSVAKLQEALEAMREVDSCQDKPATIYCDHCFDNMTYAFFARLALAHPEDTKPVAWHLWRRALDLIEWANDLRMGSRPDVGEWAKERSAFHNAILAHPEDAPDGPKVVCLCGSTRFYEAFQRANYEETMRGHIVLSVGFYPHSQMQVHGGDVGCTEEQKRLLDELHLRKIDLADEILVLNVGGYVGESTAREIVYAEEHSKLVRFLEPVNRLKGGES